MSAEMPVEMGKVKEHSSNRLLSALFLGGDAVLSRLPLPRRPHILIACMPKSGSTFLATALSELPGLRRCRLTPAWGDREQELCPIRLSCYNYSSYIAQHHLRNSDWTQHLIKKYHLTTVVLVRNLADSVISIRDHLRHEPQSSPQAYFTPEHAKLSDAELEECIVNLVIPWYLNFYLGWKQCKKSRIFFYNDLLENPEAVMTSIFEMAGINPAKKDIQNALDITRHKNTRLNVGVSGRGKQLTPKAAEALIKLLDWYPELKDDRLFRETRESLLPAEHVDQKSSVKTA